MRAVIAILLGGITLSAPAVGADPLKEAAEDAANCRALRDPDVRLACLDAASEKLAEALGSVRQAERSAPAAPAQAEEPRSAAEPPAEETEDVPTWAAAPRHSETEREADPREFEATIVRITRNNVGRHRFYTEDGAVWEQTQLVEFRPPRSLPAVAEFNRKLTGNPTIKFDVSNRSYRVRRIE
jgi:hypothetical protein